MAAASWPAFSGRAGPSTRSIPTERNGSCCRVGFRNEYDAAFNRQGDLFTYDADMEWDFNTPWYRPTRVCLAASGAEFGWRNGTGKMSAYYPDSLPAVVDIGPGSPTGVTFGYGAKFPAKYQEAFFICDWSYGKLYAVHLKPKGAASQAEVEEFLNGSPAAPDRHRHQPDRTGRCTSPSAAAARNRACTASPTPARNRPLPPRRARAHAGTRAAQKAGSVPRPQGPEGGRDGVAAPEFLGPLHPLCRPRCCRVPGRWTPGAISP